MLTGLNGVKDSPIAALHELSARIRDRVAYSVGITDVSTTAKTRCVSVKVSARTTVHLLRLALLGLSARYVSGYLMMNDRVDQDANHAWAEVHIEGLGWVGFDISNGISPDERYVRLSYGLDYTDAAPTSA